MRRFPTLWDLPVWARLLHGTLILYMAGEVAYAAFQVFFVLQPAGVVGPMLTAAREVPHELMVVRRLYAIEAWIAFVGLALYLGITEFLPRLVRIYLANPESS